MTSEIEPYRPPEPARRPADVEPAHDRGGRTYPRAVRVGVVIELGDGQRHTLLAEDVYDAAISLERDYEDITSMFHARRYVLPMPPEITVRFTPRGDWRWTREPR